MLAFDRKFTLADNDLPKVAKACELAAMEVAFPLISDEIVAFSLATGASSEAQWHETTLFFQGSAAGISCPTILSPSKSTVSACLSASGCNSIEACRLWLRTA